MILHATPLPCGGGSLYPRVPGCQAVSGGEPGTRRREGKAVVGVIASDGVGNETSLKRKVTLLGTTVGRTMGSKSSQGGAPRHATVIAYLALFVAPGIGRLSLSSRVARSAAPRAQNIPRRHRTRKCRGGGGRQAIPDDSPRTEGRFGTKKPPCKRGGERPRAKPATARSLRRPSPQALCDLSIRLRACRRLSPRADSSSSAPIPIALASSTRNLSGPIPPRRSIQCRRPRFARRPGSDPRSAGERRARCPRPLPPIESRDLVSHRGERPAGQGDGRPSDRHRRFRPGQR